MKCITKNLIIEAALRSIQDALPVIEHEAGKEELRHKQHWGERCDLIEENAVHRKYIDELEAKQQKWLGQFDYIKELETKNHDLARDLWINEEETQEAKTDLADWERENVALRKTCKELESNLRTEKIKTEHYAERLNEFELIVDETHAYWEKKDLRSKTYIEYLNDLLARNENAMKHEEALEENAARDGRPNLPEWTIFAE